MGGYPSDYYVMPDHQVRLSEDRKKVWFKQPLPFVRKDDLIVEVHEQGICLDFNPERKNPVHKCITIMYKIDPDSAVANFKDGMLTVAAELVEAHKGKSIKIQ